MKYLENIYLLSKIMLGGEAKMENNILLSPKKILNKQFEVDIKGYNMEQVDHFLDIVKSDYESFAVMINELYSEIEQIQTENDLLKKRINDLENEKLIHQDNMRSMEEKLSSNIDILKRISNLEREVFKGK